MVYYLHKRISNQQGVASLEGVYVILIMLLFILAFYATASYVWSQTVLGTSAVLSAQSGVVAYDRDTFATGVLTPAEQAQRSIDAEARARVAASITFESLRRNPDYLRVLNIDPNATCNGITFNDPKQNPGLTIDNNTGSGFGISVQTSADWQVGPNALFHKCLNKSISARVAVK